MQSHAAISTYSFFNVNTCVAGEITDELSGADAYNEDSEVQKNAKGRWILEYWYENYGYCTMSKDEISCDVDSSKGFPLRGATFRHVEGYGSLPSYRCTKGCAKSVPTMIHDQGYENEPGDKNVWGEKMYKKFVKKCGKPKR